MISLAWNLGAPCVAWLQPLHVLHWIAPRLEVALEMIWEAVSRVVLAFSLEVEVLESCSTTRLTIQGRG